MNFELSTNEKKKLINKMPRHVVKIWPHFKLHQNQCPSLVCKTQHKWRIDTILKKKKKIFVGTQGTSKQIFLHKFNINLLIYSIIYTIYIYFK